MTGLRFAAHYGHTDNVVFLLDAGLDPNFQGKAQASPLYLAVQGNHTATTELLLQKGADPHGGPQEPASPLYRALETNNLKLIDLLLRHGADVIKPNKVGNTDLPAK